MIHTTGLGGAGEARSTRRYLVERTRAVLLLCAVFATLFAVRELGDPAARLGVQSLVRVLGIGLAAFGVWALRGQWAIRHAWRLAVGIIATAYVMTAVAGMLGPTPIYATTAVLFVGAALTTATVLPWGLAQQALTAGIGAAALIAAVLWKDGSLGVLATEPAAAVGIGFAFSLVMARELARHRDARRRDQHSRRRAERALRHLNAVLEARVAARTQALDLANRQLTAEIAEHRRTAAAMRVTQAQLADIVDNSTAIVSLKDVAGRYLLVNREFERVFGCTRDDVVGQSDADLFPPALAAWLRARDAEVLREGNPVSYEDGIERDGCRRPYVCLKFPLRGPDGEPYGVGSMATDITAVKQLEETLRRHQSDLARLLRRHSIGAVAAALTADLTEPLTAISEMASEGARRLRTGLFDLRETLESFEELAYQAQRAQRLLRGIGPLIAREPGEKRPVDLTELAGAAVRVLEPQARRHGVTVRLEHDAELPPVTVQPAQIEQVMVSLLENGVEATAERENGVREVVLAAHRKGDAIEVAVRDTGAGIPPTMSDQLFTPFATTKPYGLGLGLAVSRSIVERHGGRLWAAPHGAGGATFRFSLPIAPPERRLN